MECCCCFSDINTGFSCKSGHTTCKECLNRGMSVAVGQNKIMGCFDQSGCKELYSHNQLNSGINDKKLLAAYNEIELHHAMKNVDITGLVSCPFCPNKVVVEEHQNVFYCETGCKKYSCISCKKDNHPGDLCEKHKRDEEATEKSVISCCNVKLILGDGCNKLKCITCNRLYCWLCKDDITEVGYHHFQMSDCVLYNGTEKHLKPAGRNLVIHPRQLFPHQYRLEQNYQQPVQQFHPVYQRQMPQFRPVQERAVRCTKMLRRGQCKNRTLTGNKCHHHRT